MTLMKHEIISDLSNTINAGDKSRTPESIRAIICSLSLRDSKALYESLNTPVVCEYRELIKSRLQAFTGF